MTKSEALESFKTNVCAKGKEIDPNEERDWYDLSLGYFLALGLTPEEAENAAIEARYDHQYWS